MNECRSQQEEAHPSLSDGLSWQPERPGSPHTFTEPSLKLLSIMSSKGLGPPSTSLLITAGTSAGAGSAAAFLPLRLIMKAESLSKLQEQGKALCQPCLVAQTYLHSCCRRLPIVRRMLCCHSTHQPNGCSYHQARGCCAHIHDVRGTTQSRA